MTCYWDKSSNLFSFSVIITVLFGQENENSNFHNFLWDLHNNPDELLYQETHLPVKYVYSEKATNFCKISNGQIYGGDFLKFCGLLRIYEL